MSLIAESSKTSSTSNRVLLCLAHLRWNFVYQRPQHLMSRAAVHQTVLFFEEPVFADSGELPRLETQQQPCGVIVAVPVLKHGMAADEQVTAQRLLLDRLLGTHPTQDLTLWYYTPMALRFTAHLRPELCIYDCMDELSAFKFAPPALIELEWCLFERTHLVFTGGRSLYHAKRGRHPECHLFPSAVDIAHFSRARAPATCEPSDQALIPHPRVGFAGVIDERMDLGLVEQLAELRPDIHLVFIGPVVKIDPATLPRRHNIHWLGARVYAELPEYLGGWDAAFMPFALNESTRFISPTKTPEFLAAGLPVISTPIADVVTPYGELGLVEIGSTAADFSERLGHVLQLDSSDWAGRVDAHLRGISWDDTWSLMRELMAQAKWAVTNESHEYDSDYSAALALASGSALRV
jgi:glycosyltransferase involved in cell wall biosynthesis